ncbi:DUF6861 domain-containing protein [Aquabacterium sp.]|uniref:DUF6861 domain-containing protein n=1 Tax=Aquabacterium sp. TaxID=1872578 RepID=UPI00248A0297|nr:hypothetical protein [Aquabacterium sp.]MDI1261221.1 hypothetical protein [Aquabacterium sp.]
MSRWTNWLGPLDCTDNLKALKEAYEIGVMEMPGEVYKETGYQVAAFMQGLIPMLMQVLIALSASTALGGAIGAAVGVFFGGAGAIPGAAFGAQAGFDLGVLVITWLGLAFLIEAIGHGMVELTSLLTQAVRRAWDAPNTPQSRQQIRLAGQDLARCGAILMRLILQGIVAWLSKGAATSTLTRSEASMARLTAELRQSKLGPQFTGWIEANIERLMSDPRLKPHRGRGSAAKEVVSEAQSPSKLANRPKEAVVEAPKPPLRRVVSSAEAEQMLIEHGLSPGRAKDYVASFEGQITAREVKVGEKFLRYTDIPDSKGSFLTTKIFGSPQQAARGLYLEPYGNNASLVQEVFATKTSTVLEGAIANGVPPGTTQTLIMDRTGFLIGGGVLHP